MISECPQSKLRRRDLPTKTNRYHDKDNAQSFEHNEEQEKCVGHEIGEHARQELGIAGLHVGSGQVERSRYGNARGSKAIRTIWLGLLQTSRCINHGKERGSDEQIFELHGKDVPEHRQ